MLASKNKQENTKQNKTKQTQNKTEKLFWIQGSEIRTLGSFNLIYFFFFNRTALTLGVWNADPFFKWMETCKNWAMIYKSRGPKFGPLTYVNENK